MPDDLSYSESDIRKILKMYFEYVIEQVPPRIKIKNITVGKFLDKKIY